MQQDLSTQRAQAGRIEELLQTVATFSDPRARATTEELVHLLLDMYGQGLARLLELIAQSPTSGSDLVNTLADDELVESLLLLHGLHPHSLEERVARVLDEIQPYLTRHNAQAALLRVDEGIAYLRMENRSQGCSSTLSQIKTKVIETLNEALPDLEEVRIDDSLPSSQVQRVMFVSPRRTRSQTLASSASGEHAPGEKREVSADG
jgi:Fe-S cluster biogenesis protein NfuA